MSSHLPEKRYPTQVDLAAEYALDLLSAFLQRFDREQTRRAYRNDLEQFFGSPTITLDAARSVTFMHINRHVADLETHGHKATTIKRRLAALRGFFDWLFALELIPRNPASRELLRKVRSVRSRDSTIVFLTSDQAARLIEAADDGSESAVRDQALILTLLHATLRRSEAAAMDVEHVRPLGHYWILDLPNTKGGADQYVKLPDHVVEEIDAMRARYGIDAGPLWRSLSNNSRGRRLSERSIYTIVARAAARAGLPDSIGAHTLRHTGCTLAIEAGASLQQVQLHARHKNIETTMVYVHQRDRLRDSAADFIRVRKDD